MGSVNNPPAGISTFTELAGAAHSTAGVSGGWADLDLSAELPVGVVAVEIMMYNATAGNFVGVRKTGSALNRYVVSGQTVYVSDTVLVDANRKIQIYDGAVANSYKVWGYWK